MTLEPLVWKQLEAEDMGKGKGEGSASILSLDQGVLH